MFVNVVSHQHITHPSEPLFGVITHLSAPYVMCLLVTCLINYLCIYCSPVWTTLCYCSHVCAIPSMLLPSCMIHYFIITHLSEPLFLCLLLTCPSHSFYAYYPPVWANPFCAYYPSAWDILSVLITHLSIWAILSMLLPTCLSHSFCAYYPSAWDILSRLITHLSGPFILCYYPLVWVAIHSVFTTHLSETFFLYLLPTYLSHSLCAITHLSGWPFILCLLPICLRHSFSTYYPPVWAIHSVLITHLSEPFFLCYYPPVGAIISVLITHVPETFFLCILSTCLWHSFCPYYPTVNCLCLLLTCPCHSLCA